MNRLADGVLGTLIFQMAYSYLLRIQETTLTRIKTAPAVRFRIFYSTLLANLADPTAPAVHITVTTIPGSHSTDAPIAT